MLCTLLLTLSTQAASTAEEAVNAAVHELYRSISYAPGENPDWSAMEAVFLPQAQLVLAYPEGRKPRVQTVKEFVAEYRQALAPAAARASGFEEKPTRLATMVFGNIAHVDAIFEARMPPSAEAPVRRGIDSIQLIEVDKEWKVLSIASALALPQRPLGDALPDRLASDLTSPPAAEEAEASSAPSPPFAKASLNLASQQMRKESKNWFLALAMPRMTVGLYRLEAGSQDGQGPHQEDEAYYVLSGKSRFQAGEQDVAVAAGDLLYVEAGVEHHFYDIEADLETLVFFAIQP